LLVKHADCLGYFVSLLSQARTSKQQSNEEKLADKMTKMTMTKLTSTTQRVSPFSYPMMQSPIPGTLHPIGTLRYSAICTKYSG